MPKRHEEITGIAVNADSVRLLRYGKRVGWYFSVREVTFGKDVKIEKESSKVTPLDLSSIFNFKSPHQAIVRKIKGNQYKVIIK